MFLVCSPIAKANITLASQKKKHFVFLMALIGTQNAMPENKSKMIENNPTTVNSCH